MRLVYCSANAPVYSCTEQILQEAMWREYLADLCVGHSAVCLLKSLKDFFNGFDPVLVDQEIQKVGGVFAETSFLADVLDNIPFLLRCHDWVEKKVLDLLVFTEQSL